MRAAAVTVALVVACVDAGVHRCNRSAAAAKGARDAAFAARLAAPPPKCPDVRFRQRAPPARVAVRLAGAIRTLNRPVVYESIQQHLLRGVAPRANDAVELFLFLSRNEGVGHTTARRHPTPRNVSSAALDYLRPVKVSFENETDADQCAFPRSAADDVVGYARAAPQALANMCRAASPI